MIHAESSHSSFYHTIRFKHVIGLFLLVAFFVIQPVNNAHANKKYSSIVIDSDTGQVLHQRYADRKLHPASLTKVMTLILVFDALQDRRIRLNDRIRISRHAASAVPSKLDLPIGSSIKVKDAIYALITKSANDIAIAIAEHLHRSERNFARMMTRKARQIGMSKTTFINASGLHTPRQISTARDMAIMGRYLIQNYPNEYKYFSRRYFTYQGKTYRNHNRLMASYKGMDGIKTGYVNASGFNLLASAERHNRRLIGVVFGGRTTRSRNNHMKDLLDRSFNKIRTWTVAIKNFPIPERKPMIITALNSLSKIMPAAGQENAPSSSHWASLNTALRSGLFNSKTGQGDYDLDAEIPMQARLLQASATSSQKMKSTNNFWSIQVGAYTSRAQTDQALHQARRKLPATLEKAQPLIVPLQRGQNWLFRGRLNGYNKEQANAACLYIKDCIVIGPQK